MNTILLQPTDVLFFRDGRPMTGSLAGHGTAWPTPDVTNHALHAALHRAELAGVHPHRRGRSGQYTAERDRKFGAVLTAGPFPVRTGSAPTSGAESGAPPADIWFFPRPKDAQKSGSVRVTLRPVRSLTKEHDDPWLGSSLPDPLEYAVANTEPPSKEAGGEPWISADAFDAYLRGDGKDRKSAEADGHFLHDDSIADIEASLGIAIDPETQTTGQGTAAGKIYTAHYLRLREGFRIGLFAEAIDKENGDPNKKRDLLQILLSGRPTQIVVGGQQRICTAELKPLQSLPLPRGLTNGFNSTREDTAKRWLVKWVLLSPAIWPEISTGTSNRGTKRLHHPGGWLPNWICPDTGAVLLRSVDETERRRRRNLNYAGKGYATHEGNAGEISARLVAAIVPKPLVVTGWALPNSADPERDTNGGAKSTHLAVPAGAVYYFEADSADAAVALANALNWHGETSSTKIKNRRSTLLGEKGYGLGVCGTWDFYGGTPNA